MRSVATCNVVNDPRDLSSVATCYVVNDPRDLRSVATCYVVNDPRDLSSVATCYVATCYVVNDPRDLSSVAIYQVRSTRNVNIPPHPTPPHPTTKSRYSKTRVLRERFSVRRHKHPSIHICFDPCAHMIAFFFWKNISHSLPLPSGKHTKNSGKIHHGSMGKSTISTGPFSIAM